MIREFILQTMAMECQELKYFKVNHLNQFKVQGLLIDVFHVGHALLFLLRALKDDFGKENHFLFHLVAHNHCPILLLKEGVLPRVHKTGKLCFFHVRVLDHELPCYRV